MPEVLVGCAVVLSFLLCAGCLGLMLLVRVRPRGTPDCGNRVDVVRLGIDGPVLAGGGADIPPAAPDPSRAASASALASPFPLPFEASRVCDLVIGPRPGPLPTYTELGLPSLEGGGIVLLSVSSIAFLGSAGPELATLLESSSSASSLICLGISSPEPLRLNVGSKLRLFACFDMPFPPLSPRRSRLRLIVFDLGPCIARQHCAACRLNQCLTYISHGRRPGRPADCR
jgi:hypothetical protein